jgi:hypothetical protein
MSAGTELLLKGKAPLRRNLDLRASAYGYLSAVLCLVGAKSWHMTGLAYTNAKITDCYLRIVKHERASLWMGSTAFDVTEAEAAQIRTTYEPLGLRIETGDAAVTVAPSAAPPYVAVPDIHPRQGEGVQS